MKPTFYLDLDRTIFHTERIDEFFPVIERIYPNNAVLRNGYARREQYFVFPHRKDGDEKTYYYDLAQQLSDAGLNIDEVFGVLRKELGDGRFEYRGVDELIRTLRAHGEVKILTYGEDVYQKFKASLCPSIAGIEVITTTKPKVDYLNLYAKPGDWIIDDKVIPGLKHGVDAVHIQHNDKNLADAHSLIDVAHFLTRRLST